MDKPAQHSKNGVIAIMAKAPIEGFCKTRMQPSLTPKQSATLQSLLIKKTVLTALSANACPIQLWCHPDISLFNDFQEEASLITQAMGDLGTKMSAVFEYNRHRDFVIIIGTDCPQLTSEHINNAIHHTLEHKVTIIPANDGGYVLIGAAQHPNCFENIDWGTDSVLRTTLQQLKSKNTALQLMHSLPDLDTIEDYERLPNSIKNELEYC